MNVMIIADNTRSQQYRITDIEHVALDSHLLWPIVWLLCIWEWGVHE